MSSSAPRSWALGRSAERKTTTDEPNEFTTAACLRLVLIVCNIFVLLFFTVDMFTTKYTLTFLTWFVDRVKDYNALVVAIILIAAISITTVVNVPTALLGLPTGFLLTAKLGFGLGVVVATLTICLGSCIGAIICFQLSKQAFRHSVADVSSYYEFLYGIEKALERKGFQINILLRFSTVIPSFVINYGIPSLGCKFDDFIYGCLLGTLPYALALSLIGALLDDLDSLDSYLKSAPLYAIIGSVLVGFVFLFLGTWYLYKFSREAIDEVIKESNQDISALDVIDARKQESDRLLRSAWDPL